MFNFKSISKMKKLLVALFFLSSWSYAQNPNFNQLDEFIDLLYKNDKIMGSLSVFKEGKPIYNKSVGYQYINRNEKKDNTVNSKFRIGSITKTFTAVMIFQLIDEGKIKLTDKLSGYFPEVPNANKIAIANLLNHSSGLFNITQDENFDEHLPITRNKMLSTISSHTVNFQPGIKNEYSNTNYILLGYILEEVERVSYKTILKKRIVDKLSLKNTYYGGVINTANNECLSYYYEDDASLHETEQAHLSNPGGAGGIVSNPSDISVFVHALFNNELISKESFKVMTTVKDEYGSGIVSATKGGQIIFAHNGAIDSFKSMFIYIPELKIVIAFNANALDYGMMPIMFNVMSAIQGQKLTMPSFENIDLIALTAVELKQYIGVYECKDLPFKLVFETDGKVLKGAPQGSEPKVLKPTKTHEFVLEDLGVVILFNLKEETLMFQQPGEALKKFTKKG